MKLTVQETPDCQEIEVLITCREISPHVERIVRQIRLTDTAITARRDGEAFKVYLDDIYYFDTTDNKTFVYMQKDVYQCDKRLYELEQELQSTSFLRVSKKCLLNTAVVESVKAQFSGRMQATLTNGEQVLVSKHYIKAFRDKMLEGGSR